MKILSIKEKVSKEYSLPFNRVINGCFRLSWIKN